MNNGIGGNRVADVLFVCVHNVGRSQMAKALFNHIARQRGLRLSADSAGTEPEESIHGHVIDVMRELGIDVSRERPKLLTNEMAESARRIITMGCDVDTGACPAVFIKGIEDWGLPDPKDQDMAGVRAVRDEVRRRVEALIVELGGALGAQA